jgi:carboxymethylenebutenolidase
MNGYIDIKATDGAGSFRAFVARPKTTPAPVVIVIQEIFGVNKVMQDICTNLATLGYLAICPDLFWRQEPGIQITDQTEAEWQKAFQLFSSFNVDKGVDDLKSSLAVARKIDGGNGKVGTMGYCLGGKLAYLMAARSDADCNVSYYGVGIEELLGESSGIKKPLLMHIAEKDKYVPPAAQAKILAALQNNKNIENIIHPGVDHAFCRIGGQHYDKNTADKANARTAKFLAAALKNA